MAGAGIHPYHQQWPPAAAPPPAPAAAPPPPPAHPHPHPHPPTMPMDNPNRLPIDEVRRYRTCVLPFF